MMKNYYSIIVTFVVLFFSAISSLLSAMQYTTNSDLGKVCTVIFINEQIAAVGSDKGCFLIFNPTNTTMYKEKLHNVPPFNLITDKKHRLGILCDGQFIAYDVTTKEKVWSPIIHGTNYSAAFSYVDDTIFLYQKGQLKSNTGIFMELPYTGNQPHFAIACHPTKKELLYPCSDTVLAVKSFAQCDQHAVEQYWPHSIEVNDCIRKAFYSDDGSCIALQTNERRLYIYYPSNKKLLSLKDPKNNCYRMYNNPIFVPKTNHVIAFVCNNGNTHYWDFKNHQRTPCTSPNTAPLFTKDNILINIFDISSQGTQSITGIHTFHRDKSLFGKLTDLVRKYWLLQQYSIENNDYLIPDIIKLLISEIYALSPFPIFNKCSTHQT